MRSTANVAGAANVAAAVGIVYAEGTSAACALIAR